MIVVSVNARESEQAMRTKYVIDDERDFANEYQISAADTPERLTRLQAYFAELPQLTQLSPRVRPITYKEARRLAVSLPAYYDRVSQQHFIKCAAAQDSQLDEPRSVQFAHLADCTAEFLDERDEWVAPFDADEIAYRNERIAREDADDPTLTEN